MFVEFAIIGTTASGKTALATQIAREFGGAILSLDSLSVYKKIDIASAKPSPKDLREVPHFGVNLIEPDENFSAGEFAKEYEKAREFALNLDTPLIITGGSGFYLKALTKGLAPRIKDAEFFPENHEIYEQILALDPKFAAKFSQNDTYRLRKWFSIFEATGEIPSVFLAKNTQEPKIRDLKIFEILWEKSELIKRIAARTQNMLDLGLIDEARRLFSEYPSETKSLNSIGLKECKEFLDAKIGISELKELITIHTTQLAKRQRTFNRSQFSCESGSFEATQNSVDKWLNSLNFR